MNWLEPWETVADMEAQYRRAWETQLIREVGPTHVLFGLPVSLIARRFDTDDALFQLPGSRVAEVHLTWSKGAEPDPVWPNAAIFESLEVWARESMAPQHQQWAEDD